MTEPPASRRYRFGVFEADAATGELRRQGLRIRLNAQSFQVLLALLDRPGELIAREQISRELWPDGTFVDYEHGLNSAVNRIREALGDNAGSPRFVETLARRGYRFVAPVERIGVLPDPIAALPESPLASAPEPLAPTVAAPPAYTQQAVVAPESEPSFLNGILASPEELPSTSHTVVQTLFVLLQLMYVGFYVGALANLPEIEDLFSPLAHESEIVLILIATAAILIPVRAFLISAVIFHPPRARRKLLRLWPFVLPLDILWALSPFLLLHHISVGLALACTGLLVYSPFAQRSLVLMGAGGDDAKSLATAR